MQIWHRLVEESFDDRENSSLGTCMDIEILIGKLRKFARGLLKELNPFKTGYGDDVVRFFLAS